MSRRRQGSGTGIATSVQSGEMWFVEGPHTGFRTDSASGERTFYATSGTITSCDLTEPHYHFKSKEVKMFGRRALVARPAVLYIRDIPVMWVPFIYQDLREGRRSGLLPPRFGFSDIVRNSSGYRRQIDGLGWYWAISDYMDAQIETGWRSGAQATDDDPGWLDLRAQWQYNWLARAMRGGLAWTQNHADERSGEQLVSSLALAGILPEELAPRRPQLPDEYQRLPRPCIHRRADVRDDLLLAQLRSRLRDRPHGARRDADNNPREWTRFGGRCRRCR